MANNHLDRPLFYATHRVNLSIIIRDNAIQSPKLRPEGYREIWDAVYVPRRRNKPTGLMNGETLDAFVAFQLATRNPATYNIQSSHFAHRIMAHDLIFLVTTGRRLEAHGAALATITAQPLCGLARFLPGLRLDEVDLTLIDSGKFFNIDTDRTRKWRFAAEVLAHQRVPLSAFYEIICWSGAADIHQFLASIDPGQQVLPTVVCRQNAYFN